MCTITQGKVISRNSVRGKMKGRKATAPLGVVVHASEEHEEYEGYEQIGCCVSGESCVEEPL